MSCLGERLTALVDGELGHEERDRALAHLAGCARCRSEADLLRRLKRRLRGLGDLPAADGAHDLPSTDFMARLRGLADADPGAGHGAGLGADPDAGADDRSVPASAPPVGAPVPSIPVVSPLHARPRARDDRPAARAGFARSTGFGVARHVPVPSGLAAAAHGAAAALPRHPRRRYLAVGAATLVIGLGAASYAAGGQREAPAVSPAFDRFAVEHALTSGDVPLTDPVDDRSVVPPAPGP